MDNAGLITDILPQDGNANINNKILADSASLQIKAISECLVPKNISRCE